MNRSDQISHQIDARRVRKPFSLPSGATGFTNDSGQWVCTGSQMGRRNVLPDDPGQPVKLRLIRLPFVDGCYDRWGCYWGSPANVWLGCYGEHKHTELQGFARVPVQVSQFDVEVYVRALSRWQARAEVRKVLPQARFYR